MDKELRQFCGVIFLAIGLCGALLIAAKNTPDPGYDLASMVTALTLVGVGVYLIFTGDRR